MNEEQFATTARPYSDFPPEWGTPEGSRYSEQRAAWIKRNLEAGEERLDRGEKLSWKRPRTARQALAALEARVWSENRARLYELLLKRRGPQ